jgi:hypothetical protein
MIGELLSVLIPGSGALHLFPTGIGFVISIPLLVVAYGQVTEESVPPGRTDK